MKFADIGVALVVVTIILLIIIPIPLQYLDFFLALNISLALLILFISMFIREPLEFAVFPTILLISTIFRLALNISTTRYILTQGSAGDVITTFGNFAVMGNAIVGFIIFIIIVIIQFLVITKGSERVSEVAARFTLDAMPGKQMAIDADLNSGLIDESQARIRREKIQREADFYGSMDGASKFVKGDAIAGIIITMINLVAGIVIGIFVLKLSATEAMSKFALLTVGDGLVSQIPALMISVATGITVTRATSEENIGHDIVDQMFSNYIVLMLLGMVVLVLGLATPLPKLPFSTLGIMAVSAGLYKRNQKVEAEAKKLEVEQETQGESPDEELRKPENIIPLLQVDPIEIEFGYGLIPLADPNQGGDLYDRLVMIRRQIAMELGVVVPMIRMRDNIQLEANQYMIKIKGNEIAMGEIAFDHYMAMNPGNVEGEISGEETIEPAFGLPAKWITQDQREEAELLGYTVVDPSSIISTHLTEVIKKNCYDLLTREDVKQLIDNIKEENTALIEELTPRLLSYGDIQKVLANLLKEGISIRDLVTILETLADYAISIKDVNILTEYVRQKMAIMITKNYFPYEKAKVVTLDQSLENELMGSVEQNEQGSYMAIDPMKGQQIINGIAVEVQKLMGMGEQPVLVTAPIVRYYLKQFTEQALPELIVLSYNELDSSVEIQSVGTVSI